MFCCLVLSPRISVDFFLCTIDESIKGAASQNRYDITFDGNIDVLYIFQWLIILTADENIVSLSAPISGLFEAAITSTKEEIILRNLIMVGCVIFPLKICNSRP